MSIGGRVARQANDTLRQALAAKHLPTDTAKLANFDKSITSWVELDDANQYMIAYYLDDGTNGRNGKARAFRTRTQIRLSLTITVTAPS